MCIKTSNSFGSDNTVKSISDILHPCKSSFDETYVVYIEDGRVVVVGVYDNRTGGYVIDDDYSYVNYAELLNLLSDKNLVVKGATFSNNLQKVLEKRGLSYSIDRAKYTVLAQIGFKGESYYPSVLGVVLVTGDLESDIKAYCESAGIRLVDYSAVIIEDVVGPKALIHLDGIE